MIWINIPLAKTIRELPANRDALRLWMVESAGPGPIFRPSHRESLRLGSKKINALPHQDLVVDWDAKGFAAWELGDVLSTLNSRVVSTAPGGAVYEIDKALPFEPFGAHEQDPTIFGPDTSPLMVLTPQREGSITRKAASHGSNPTRPCGCDGKTRPMSRSRSMSRRSWPPKRGTLPCSSAFKA